MPRFSHGPVEIDYLDEGEGDPVVLVHGFASTKEINWAFPGWITTLRRSTTAGMANRPSFTGRRITPSRPWPPT
jgi:pimeloyl-ACP methyl ester carboxylesterase